LKFFSLTGGEEVLKEIGDPSLTIGDKVAVNKIFSRVFGVDWGLVINGGSVGVTSKLSFEFSVFAGFFSLSKDVFKNDDWEGIFSLSKDIFKNDDWTVLLVKLLREQVISSRGGGGS